MEAAQRVAGGDLLFGTKAFYASPLYLYFLALIFSIAGPSLTVARFVQVLVGTLGLALAIATARRLYGRQTALISGALLALTGIVTFFEVVILQSALDPALMALDGWLLVRAARKDTPMAWGLAGAGLGLHALNRPNLLACAAACVLFVAIRKWKQNRDLTSALRFGASVALGAALAIAPVTLRNFAVSGEPILISSHGGLNLYIGNHSDADGAYRPIDGIAPTIDGQATDARRVVSAAVGHPVGDAEVSTYFVRKAWDWVRDNPAAAARLTGRKLLFLLNATSPSLNYSYSYYSHEESALLRLMIVGPWILIPLGIAGLIVSLRTDAVPGLGLWAAITGIYGASVILFFVTDRYQLPLLVPLAIAGARTITYVWTERRTFSRIALPLAVVTLGALITNLNLGQDGARSEERIRTALLLIERGDDARAEDLLALTMKTHRHPEILHYQAGVAYAKRREFSAADAHVRKAMEIKPGLVEAELLLGRILLETGRAEEAIPHLRRATSDPAASDHAGVELVKALAATGRVDEAAGLLPKLRPPQDTSPETLTALGALGLQLRQPTAAVRLFEAALRADPANQAIVEQLAIARGLAGDLDGAVQTLASALQQAPASPSLHLNLAVTYAQSGRMEEARREAIEALRLRPDYPQAQAVLQRLGPPTR